MISSILFFRISFKRFKKIPMCSFVRKVFKKFKLYSLCCHKQSHHRSPNIQRPRIFETTLVERKKQAESKNPYHFAIFARVNEIATWLHWTLDTRTN